VCGVAGVWPSSFSESIHVFMRLLCALKMWQMLILVKRSGSSRMLFVKGLYLSELLLSSDMVSKERTCCYG
jgi:hypothetical protein